MPTTEERLAALGYVLPEPLKLPHGVTLPFPWVRVVGLRAIISGHGPTNADGSLAHPLGKVGTEVTEEQAYELEVETGVLRRGRVADELTRPRLLCHQGVAEGSHVGTYPGAPAA